MNNCLKAQCDLFIKNRDILKAHFILENSALYPLCASLYSEKGLEVDIQKLKQAKDLIKDHTGLFSSFRGNIHMILAAKLALDDNPKAKLERTKEVYTSLKSRFLGSPYIVLAAVSIEEQTPPSAYQEVVEKSVTFYEKIKRTHPFITSKEDLTFITLYATSEIPEEEALKKMDTYHRLLNSAFFSSNAVQALSHALAFSSEPEGIICHRFMQLFNRLKDNGCKYGTGIELANLGLFAISLKEDQVEEAAHDILEVNRYLLNSTGFGALGIGKVQRLIYSTFMTTVFYKSETSKMNLTAINSITHLLIAQQMGHTYGVAHY